MAHFERMDFPELNRTSFYIIDDYGNRAELTTAQAYELYAWLHTHADVLFQTLHPEVKQDPEDYENVAHATFLELGQESSALFPPRTIRHVSPQDSINEVLGMIERIQHPLSAESQMALDEIVNEQRHHLQASQDTPEQ